jgi:hypothetical protein
VTRDDLDHLFRDLETALKFSNGTEADALPRGAHFAILAIERFLTIYMINPDEVLIQNLFHEIRTLLINTAGLVDVLLKVRNDSDQINDGGRWTSLQALFVTIEFLSGFEDVRTAGAAIPLCSLHSALMGVLLGEQTHPMLIRPETSKDGPRRENSVKRRIKYMAAGAMELEYRALKKKGASGQVVDIAARNIVRAMSRFEITHWNGHKIGPGTVKSWRAKLKNRNNKSDEREGYLNFLILMDRLNIPDQEKANLAKTRLFSERAFTSIAEYENSFRRNTPSLT